MKAVCSLHTDQQAKWLYFWGVWEERGKMVLSYGGVSYNQNQINCGLILLPPDFSHSSTRDKLSGPLSTLSWVPLKSLQKQSFDSDLASEYGELVLSRPVAPLTPDWCWVDSQNPLLSPLLLLLLSPAALSSPVGLLRQFHSAITG